MQNIKMALGFIETIGLVAAITAADAALKAAHVTLIGRENSRGGMITIKIAGNVSAVKAALSAAKAASERVNRVWSIDVIPRPGRGVGEMLAYNQATLGSKEWLNLISPPVTPEREEPVSDDTETVAFEEARDEPKEETSVDADVKPKDLKEDKEAKGDKGKGKNQVSGKKTTRKKTKKMPEKHNQDVIEREGGKVNGSGSPGND
ncbi:MULTISPECIES: BMC domain-containing protein [Acetomicrobium]|uniref:BMC domain-containing protein n=1 Tax=Acetomicrobium TaxID=49894 RepID=UPI0026F16AD3|nr:MULTISPECIES: BMC domain-containing protein [Acetomicrobium]MDR9771054.1 BMC domain-containing protein [Acetomicrobium sp.]